MSRITKLQFEGLTCFKKMPIEIVSDSPITLIIGKNNTGKSHYLEALDIACSSNFRELMYRTADYKEIIIRVIVEEEEETSVKTSHIDMWHGGIDGSYYYERGKSLQTKVQEDALSIFGEDDIQTTLDVQINTPLIQKTFKKISAERDILPQPSSHLSPINPKGNNVTVFVRNYLQNTAKLSHSDLIEEDLLHELNRIVDPRDPFCRINVKATGNQTEIFLKKEGRPWFSLSESGSGLKTVILVLLNVLVVPVEEKKDLRDYVFAFEELENNLHPSAFRKLLEFIESKASTEGPFFYLTTHSSVPLDYFSTRSETGLVHIYQDKLSYYAKHLSLNADSLRLLRDLGARPSDVLQANGVIWVEGPSDRIYINKWINLWSNGQFQEGRHYQCMFYGGSLLSNLEAKEGGDYTEKFINLLKMNPNLIVVSDSDKSSPDDALKSRVTRVRDEVESLDKDYSMHWILGAREIENYLTGELINNFLTLEIKGLRPPEQYESFFPKKSNPDSSYIENQLEGKTINKTSLAITVCDKMSIEMVSGRFDLNESMLELIERIKKWNA